MKKFIPVLLLLMMPVVVVFLTVNETHQKFSSSPDTLIEAPQGNGGVTTPPPLSELVKEIMDFNRCKGSSKNTLSEARKQVLAAQIERILTEVGGTRHTQETFILLLCLETQFRTGLKSPVGATGIAQVMPATAKEVAKKLGLGDVQPDDLLDPELNLLLGYTYFLGLVERFNGNEALAAGGYNSGPGGATVKGLSTGAAGAAESDKYVRDTYYLKESLRLTRTTE
jgi:hypothetical protein